MLILAERTGGKHRYGNYGRFAKRPYPTRDPAREAIEALAIAGYRSAKLTSFQASRLLGFSSRFEFEAFLKVRGIYDHAYGVDDLAEDWNTLGKRKPDAEGHPKA